MKSSSSVYILLLVFSVPIISHESVENSTAICERLEATNYSKVKQKYRTKTTAHFGLMLSFPDPQGRPSFASSFDDGHDIAPAVYLAVKQVNNQSDLLADYHIEIVQFDGGCDVTGRTAIGVNELVCSCENIVGIIGPSCESSSKTVSHLTNREEFSMITINYGGQNAGVGNYPYSFGILGSKSDTMYSMAVVELMKYNNWTNYTLLYSDSDPHYRRGQEILNLSHVEPGFTSAIDHSYIPLEAVLFSRIIIVLAPSHLIYNVLCLAYHQEKVFPCYQWIFPQVLQQPFSNVSLTNKGIIYKCSEREINISINGGINFVVDAFSGCDVLGDGYELQTNDFSTTFNMTSKTRGRAGGFYDAVWALAYALNDSLADLNTSLSEFKLGSPVLAESIRNHMFKLDFRGITGNIKFDSNTGFKKEIILNIYQYGLNEGSTKIGIYKDEELTLFPNSSPRFIDSMFNIEKVQIDIRVVASIFIFTAISFILVVSSQIVNVCYRNHKGIKASSPTLNHLIFIGSYMIIIGIILHTMETFVQISDTKQLYFCKLVPFLFSIGITLFLGTVCVKTWRLNRIYVHSKRLKKGDIKFIKDYILAGFVSALVIVDLLVCIIWLVTDPFMLRTTKYILYTSDREPVVALQDVCHSLHEPVWLSVLIIPKFLLTIALYWLARSTNFYIKEFKTNNIIFLTYFLIVIFGLGIPIYAVIHFKFSGITLPIDVAVLCISLNLSICISAIIPFLPLMCRRT